MMNEGVGNTVIATLESLEERLRRVEWYLSDNAHVSDTPQDSVNKEKDQSVNARLANLENKLGQLSASSPVVYDLLRLRECIQS